MKGVNENRYLLHAVLREIQELIPVLGMRLGSFDRPQLSTAFAGRNLQGRH